MMVARFMGWLACAGAVALLIVAVVSGSTSVIAAPAAPRVSGATIRLAVVPGRPAAGYFTLTAGAVPVALTAVECPGARVELHASGQTGGVMRMTPLQVVRVAAGASATFAPGGNHLMLFNLPPTLRPGTAVPLTFIFADGTRLRAAATVLAPATMPGMPM